jgi:putative ABC transport system permease protein
MGILRHAGYYLRILGKRKLFTVVNLFGLVLGLLIFMVMFLTVKEELVYDSYHANSKKICRVLVNKDMGQNYQSYVHGALAAALENQFPEITKYARYAPVWPIDKNSVRNGELTHICSGSAVDSSFFNIFSFHFLEGEPSTAFQNPNSIILTRSTAQVLFGDEPCLGKPVKFEIFGRWVNVEISAIIEDIPYNSSIQADFFINTALMERFRRSFSSWDDISTMAYIQTHENVSLTDLNEKVRGFIKDQRPESRYTVHLQPLEKIHLHNYGGGGDIIYVYINIIIGLFTLIIAVINYVNLSITDYSTRNKEIRIKKINGCSKKQIKLQFMIESIVLTAFAMALAIAFLFMLIPIINQSFDKHISINLASDIVLSAVVLIITIGLIAGFYPSYTASRIKPLAQEHSIIQVGSRKITLRSIMVLLQFLVSIVLINSAVIINKQLRHILERDPGYTARDIINVEMNSSFKKSYKLIKEELLEIPSIINVTAANTSFVSTEKSTGDALWKGKEEGDRIFIELHPVDYDYLETLNMEMVTGRFFDPDILTDEELAVVINETAARSMGFENPVGEKIECYWGSELRKSRVIGVVKDFNFESVRNEIKPLFFSIVPWWYNELYIKTNPGFAEIDETLAIIERIVKTYVPDYTMNYSFLEEDVENLYANEKLARKLTIIGAVIAILIACFGILALSSYEAIRRNKELSIRKINGASDRELYYILLKQNLAWIVLANLIAWPLSVIFMNRWLQNYVYKIDLSPWVFIMTAIVTILLAAATTSTQTIKTVRSKPVIFIK